LANLTGGAKLQDDRRLAFSELHMEEELTPAEVAALNLLAAKHLKYEKHCASSSAALLPSKDAMSKRDALWETFAPVMRDVPDDAPPPADRAEPTAAAAAAAVGEEPPKPWLCNTTATQNHAASMRGEWRGQHLGGPAAGPGGGAGRTGRVHQPGVTFERETFHGDVAHHKWRHGDSRVEKGRMKTRGTGVAAAHRLHEDHGAMADSFVGEARAVKEGYRAANEVLSPAALSY
jgi:hypothetical protein